MIRDPAVMSREERLALIKERRMKHIQKRSLEAKTTIAYVVMKIDLRNDDRVLRSPLGYEDYMRYCITNLQTQ